MTTLADLTEEQRANCVGMWADTPHGTGVIFTSAHQHSLTLVMLPAMSKAYTGLDTEIHLRPDLPRAWNPTGTPPAGQWEEAEDERLSHTGEVTDTCIMRRFVGEWEPIE